MTYQGSKARYAKYICPILQKCIDENHVTTFIDCCCGGANVVKLIKCPTRIAIDTNHYVIALLQQMQDPAFKFPEHMTREDWNRCKNGDEPREWFVGLCSIFCSYFTRGFSSGYCNDAHPEGRHYYEERVRTAEKDRTLIKDIQFIADDFERILTYENCVIYCDPPYHSTVGYDFSKNFPYERFYDTLRTSSKNNFVFVSEQQAPEDFISIWNKNTIKHVYTNQKKMPEQLFIYQQGLAYNYLFQKG